MTQALGSIKGVLFDLDGTLADSRLEFSVMCQEANLPVGTPLLEYCVGLGECDEADNLRAIIEKHEMAGAERAKWIGGADVLVGQLLDAEVPMAIVTRNMRAAADRMVEKLEIPISLMLTREDCEPKPHPEGLLRIAEQWGIAPNCLAYVGDYKYDMLAASNAGMLGVMIRNERNAQFIDLADVAMTHFEELLPYLSADLRSIISGADD